MSEKPHKYYGSGDGLGPNGECAECKRRAFGDDNKRVIERLHQDADKHSQKAMEWGSRGGGAQWAVQHLDTAIIEREAADLIASLLQSSETPST